MTLTIAFLGFAGILLPIIMQIIQSRSFRHEEKSFQGLISQELLKTKNELSTTIERSFELERKKLDDSVGEKLKVLESSIQEKMSVAKAGIFFLQARDLLKGNEFAEAARDFAHAAVLAFSGKDDLNGQRALNALIEKCILQLKQTDFTTFPELEENIEKLLKYLESHDGHGRFKDAISKIIQERTKAKNKNP